MKLDARAPSIPLALERLGISMFILTALLLALAPRVDLDRPTLKKRVQGLVNRGDGDVLLTHFENHARRWRAFSHWDHSSISLCGAG